jgi:hypothetical protein
MTGGEKALVVGAVGLGIIAILKSRTSPTNVISPPGSPPVINSRFDRSAIGLAGPLGAPLAIVADNVTTPVISSINKAVGGVNPYAGLKKNPDGTYTDGMGCTIKFNANGTYQRTCHGTSIADVGVKVVKWVKGIF